MGILRKLFPKRKESKDETITSLRSTINQFTLRTRNYYNKAISSRESAKKYLKQGNNEASRSQLKRWIKYNALSNRYQQQIDLLEDTIESIQSAEDTVAMNRALKSANKLLSNATKILTIEDAINTRVETQELVNEIEAKQSELSQALELGEADESIIDREFEKLQNEVAIEETAILPEAPREAPEELSKRERVKREVEELKKALSEEDIREKE